MPRLPLRYLRVVNHKLRAGACESPRCREGWQVMDCSECRGVQLADYAPQQTTSSFNHQRNFETERLGGLEVEDQLNFAD